MILSNRYELAVLRKRYHVEACASLLYIEGKKIFYLAMFVPFFLTTSSFRAENLFTAMICVAILHWVWTDFAIQMTFTFTETAVSIQRIQVGSDKAIGSELFYRAIGSVSCIEFSFIELLVPLIV